MRETFELLGKIPSKKNNYGYNSSTRRRFVPKQISDDLDRLALQIPPFLRGSQLLHPRIDIRVLYKTANQDRDNQYQALLDLFKTHRVIVDDNIKQFNSTQRILPAVKWAYNGVLVTIDTDGDADHEHSGMPTKCPRCGL